MILDDLDFFHHDNIPEFYLSTVVFNLKDGKEIAFKRFVKYVFSKCLKEYRCYCFFLVGHVNTGRIEKRKNEIKLASIVNGRDVGYLVMDCGVFACFEVDLSNFDIVYGAQYKFALSKSPKFISSIASSLESSSYDAFVRLFSFMMHPRNPVDEFNPRSFYYYNPLIERCLKGDFIVETCFSKIYSEKKILSVLYKKGDVCQIVGDLEEHAEKGGRKKEKGVGD